MKEEEPYEEVEPVEEGELHIQDEADVIMEPLEEQNLPDPPLEETEVQSESDIEMWETKREPPTYVEIYFSFLLYLSYSYFLLSYYLL